ncbi:MAG: HlyD family type I secretion periplasmic adaptor subunit [Pseudomonadota bacterium]
MTGNANPIARKGVFARSAERSARRGPKLAGILVLTITGFLGGMLWMATTTKVPELTRASGALVPTGRYHQIQAPEAGIVVSVEVAEGQSIQRGQVLAELSSRTLDQQEEALQQEVAGNALKLQNYHAILAATQESAQASTDLTFEGMHYAATQIRLLAQKQRAQDELVARLNETLDTLQRARDLAEKRVNAKAISVEKDEELFAKGLTTARDLDAQKDRLDQLQASLVDVDVRLSQLQKDLSTALTKATQERLGLQEKYAEQIFELELRQQALVVQAAALNAQREALRVRAPENGVVHAISFPNPGEVIAAGDVLFELLPTEQNLVAEIEVNPLDIGHIAKGDAVALKFDTFDPRRYGQVTGEIISISPNSVLDRETGQEHFRATVALSDATIGQGVWQRKLQSGMTTTAEIVTDERTVLAYLLKPINRSLDNAFGER